MGKNRWGWELMPTTIFFSQQIFLKNLGEGGGSGNPHLFFCKKMWGGNVAALGHGTNHLAWEKAIYNFMHGQYVLLSMSSTQWIPTKFIIDCGGRSTLFGILYYLPCLVFLINSTSKACAWFGLLQTTFATSSLCLTDEKYIVCSLPVQFIHSPPCDI